MADERTDIRRRFTEGVQDGAPVHIDGQPLGEFFAAARKGAEGTPDGRLILLEAEIARKEAEEAQKQRRTDRLAELDKLIAEQLPAVDAAPAQTDPTFVGPAGTGQVGLLEVGLTFLTGALAEPIAGLAALTGFLGKGGGIERANERLAFMRDAMTFQPRTAGGKAVLQGMGSVIMEADTLAAKGSAIVSLGNPFAENLIYTTIIKGTETALTFAGLRAGSAVKSGPRINSTRQLAKDLGVDTQAESFGASVVQSARDMTPAVRDANAPALRKALQDAKTRQAAEVESLRQTSARNQQQILDIDTVNQLGQASTKQLIDEGFNVQGMPTVKRLLESLENFSTQSPGSTLPRTGLGPNSTPIARLSELDIIGAQIEARLLKVKDDPSLPRSVREAEALRSLDKKVNDWVEHQFNQGMINGNPETIAAWRTYNETRVAGRVFNEDRVLVQLMQEEATPKQIVDWVFGARAAKPKQNSTAIIGRLRSLLGDEHPSIVGIKQDFLHRVAEPLFGQPPDFDGFIRNFDTMIKENKSFIDEMGLDLQSLTQLRAFAKTAAELQPGRNSVFPDFSRSVSQYFVGHGIARAGLRVRLATATLKLMFGKTRPQQRDILRSVTEARFDGAAIDPGSATAGRLIQAMVLADIESAAQRSKAQEEE